MRQRLQRTELMSAEKVLLGFASSLLCSLVPFLTYLDSDTEIRTTRKQSLIYNTALLPTPYIIHVVFCLKAASFC